MTRKIVTRLRWKHRIGILLLAFLALMLATAAYAWTVSVRYVHDYQTDWSADDGWHRGQIEWSGGKRYIRAGDDYVKWNTFIPQSSGYLAMVYHAFQPNTNNCGNIRVGDHAWSWSNLPNVTFSTKGCGAGADNEWRAEVRNNNITAGTNYYFQHLFRDTTSGNNGTGEITTNTYWVTTFGGAGPYHGKFCINSSNVYAPTNGQC